MATDHLIDACRLGETWTILHGLRRPDKSLIVLPIGGAAEFRLYAATPEGAPDYLQPKLTLTLADGIVASPGRLLITVPPAKQVGITPGRYAFETWSWSGLLGPIERQSSGLLQVRA